MTYVLAGLSLRLAESGNICMQGDQNKVTEAKESQPAQCQLLQALLAKGVAGWVTCFVSSPSQQGRKTFDLPFGYTYTLSLCQPDFPSFTLISPKHLLYISQNPKMHSPFVLLSIVSLAALGVYGCCPAVVCAEICGGSSPSCCKRLCADGTIATPCCGYGPCNIFCCNCDDGTCCIGSPLLWFFILAIGHV